MRFLAELWDLCLLSISFILFIRCSCGLPPPPPIWEFRLASTEQRKCLLLTEVQEWSEGVVKAGWAQLGAQIAPYAFLQYWWLHHFPGNKRLGLGFLSLWFCFSLFPRLSWVWESLSSVKPTLFVFHLLEVRFLVHWYCYLFIFKCWLLLFVPQTPVEIQCLSWAV